MKIKKELFSFGSLLLLAGVAISSSYGIDARTLDHASKLKAGYDCAAPVNGGRGCDEANTADGTTEGSGCQNEGDTRRNCPSEEGTKIVKGTTKYSTSKIVRVPCPAPQIAFICVTPVDWEGNPIPTQRYWEKTKGTCGEKDAFDGTAPVADAPECTPTPTPTPDGA